jgi:hypothetical protein
MAQPGNHEVLNRLLTVLYRSLPMYLKDGQPWLREGEAHAVEVMQRIVEDQEQLGTRIGQHILEHYGPIELGSFPLDFPDTNNLAFDFLLGKLLACQKQDVATIERCVSQIGGGDFEARALAEEALGSARGHLESLEELASETAKAGVTWIKR